VSLFYAPKIIKIGGRVTKLQSVEKFFLLDTAKCNKYEHFTLTR